MFFVETFLSADEAAITGLKTLAATF